MSTSTAAEPANLRVAVVILLSAEAWRAKLSGDTPKERIISLIENPSAIIKEHKSDGLIWYEDPAQFNKIAENMRCCVNGTCNKPLTTEEASFMSLQFQLDETSSVLVVSLHCEKNKPCVEAAKTLLGERTGDIFGKEAVVKEASRCTNCKETAVDPAVCPFCDATYCDDLCRLSDVRAHYAVCAKSKDALRTELEKK